MAELKHILKEVEFQQNLVGDGFLKPPEGNFSRINIFGEISNLKEFTEENLYLFYEFSLPIGWKIDDENDYYIIYKTENIIEENINKIKSISQISKGYVDTSLENYYNIGQTNTKVAVNQDQNCFTHNFAFPFELELLCHDAIREKSPLKLLIQVNSVDSEDRHRIEGYCFVNLPSEGGSYKLEVPCYKPKEDNYMRVYSFFLGGSRKIPDLKEIAKTCSKDENVKIIIIFRILILF